MIDILLGTYNGAAFLAAQLESLLAQSHTDWRLIVRDDGSTDSTTAVTESFRKRYPDKIRVFPVDFDHSGILGNYATLLGASDAPYVMFCDQDDVWLPHKIETTFTAMRRLELSKGYHTPILIHTDSQVVNQDLKPISPSFARYFGTFPKEHAFSRLLVQNYVHGSTVMMNRALVERLLPIPAQAHMHDHWAALVACMVEGEIHYLPQVTMQYRIHAGNAVGTGHYAGLIQRLLSVPHAAASSFRQANALLERFPNAKEAFIVRTFVEGQTLEKLSRIKHALRHGFLKKPFTKALAQLLLS